jgi:uncharacterized membrane protein YphA (DoxX/SURF4 family)
MFLYGIMKIFSGQFSAPMISGLFETYGESSPMRLMWTFMGASETYTNFAGWSETIAGILLLFRRTRTIGGLAAAGVMLNVFMMNVSYDVPVKLFSLRLILTGLYVALEDRKRLFNVFIFNKPAPALEWKPIFKTPWKNYLLTAMQVIIMGNVIYSLTASAMSRPAEGARTELFGIYDTDLFIVNGDTLAPLTTSTVRWDKFWVEEEFYSSNYCGIMLMNDASSLYFFDIDEAENEIIIKPRGDTVNTYPFTYQFDGLKMIMDGVFKDDSLHIESTYFNPDNFNLNNRGFSWVSEIPFNRNVRYKK